MAVFSYEALDGQGRRVDGILDAESEEAARGRLRSIGLYPVSVRAGVAPGRFEGLFAHISQRDVAGFTRQLATLVGAGFTIADALATLSDQSTNPRLRRVVMEILDKVRAGRQLSDAIRDQGEVFGGMFPPMIRAGEKSGRLPEILAQLSIYIDRRVRLTQRVTASIAYPLVMLGVAVGVVLFLLTWVVPTLTTTFERENLDLPWVTKLLIAVCDVLLGYWWALAVGIGLALGAARAWVMTEGGRETFDRWRLTLPLIGPLYSKVLIARFVRTFGVLVRADVQILSAIEILRSVVQNVIVAQALDEARVAISQGTSIAKPLRQSGIFPPLVVDMIAAGQKAGELDTLLFKLAEDYDLEVESALTLFTSILEPLIILVMGLVVGFIVTAMVLPLMELNRAF